MIRLKDFMIEADLATITDFIQDKIDHPKDNVKTLKKMYNAANLEIAEQIKIWSYKEKFFSVDQRRCIQNIFDDYDQLDALLDIIEDSKRQSNDKKLINPEEILNNGSGTLLEIIKKCKIVDEYNIEDDMIRDLIATQPGQRGVTVGPAEIALMIFVQDCKQNNEKNGHNSDLIILKKEKEKENYVEVKGREAMFCGQNNKPRVKKVLDKLKEINITIDGIKDTSAGNKYLLSKFNKKDNKFIENFCNCFNEYYEQSKYFNEWKELVLNIVCKEDKNRIKKLLISISLWGLMEYQATENFNHLLLINTENKEVYPFVDISFTNKTNLKDLYETFKDRLKVANTITDSSSRKELPKITLIK